MSSALFKGGQYNRAYMQQSLPELLRSGKYSDLLIICGNDQYKVHRSVICPQSHFFETACNGKFKEADGEINLLDDDPLAARKMIEYLYRVDDSSAAPQLYDFEDDVEAELSDTEYDSEARYRMKLFGAEFVGKKRIKKLRERPWGVWKTKEPEEPSSKLCLHAKVYALGEKYHIPGLKEAAQRQFVDELEGSAHITVEDFVDAADEIYNSTVMEDRGLRDLIVQVIGQQIVLMDMEPVQDLMRTTDLGLDVAMAATEGMRAEARFRPGQENKGLRFWTMPKQNLLLMHNADWRSSLLK